MLWNTNINHFSRIFAQCCSLRVNVRIILATSKSARQLTYRQSVWNDVRCSDKWQMRESTFCLILHVRISILNFVNVKEIIVKFKWKWRCYVLLLTHYHFFMILFLYLIVLQCLFPLFLIFYISYAHFVIFIDMSLRNKLWNFETLIATKIATQKHPPSDLPKWRYVVWL